MNPDNSLSKLREVALSQAHIGSVINLDGEEYLVCITDDCRRFLTPLSGKKQAA